MKYLLVFGVVLFALWLWRHNRQTEANGRKATQEAAPPRAAGTQGTTPARMVSCAHCGLHLPLTEAVAGAREHYCTHAHRRAHES